MARTQRPETPAYVYDPFSGETTEAPTTDQKEMQRRARRDAELEDDEVDGE